MRLCFINPNATASMTEKIAAAARRAASPGTRIVALTNADGPPSIQGEADGEAAVPGLLALIEANAGAMDGFAIACFDDTGLAPARALTARPVVGIGEAGYRAAAEAGHRFSVVTTLAVSVPILDANIGAYGLAAMRARVRASQVPVLALEEEGEAAREKVGAEIEAAIAEDGISAVVLGCAGMADLAQTYTRRFGLPVIDGVAAAVALLEREAAAR
ncbi:aspartate/glutamate racemase family protein [Aurantimonas sp. Leaf443]|uniref:aspartate/glutamate racemase family protein n=1 Tax=Aurantimonas sp. Leaf443 TaxID=1736378 RepID=UPI0006F48384|nr:aspartate/glutamate racemase family protein [Aurantimonas sp. Leaf443]KQT82256.1 Asp/Glu/hydantoin racemase [Aurantimonas sp. Leaf443]